MRPFIIMIIFFLASLTGYSFVQQDYIIKANKAYTAGSYTTAADLYNKVVVAGYEAPELFYNLGNTYFKMNDCAHAILW